MDALVSPGFPPLQETPARFEPSLLGNALPGGFEGPMETPDVPGLFSWGSWGGGEQPEETSSPLAPGQEGCSCILGVEWSVGSASVSALFFGGAT